MIHILCVDISSADKGTYDRLYREASPERKQQADGYRRQEDKLRCVTAHALLKTALGTDRFQVEKQAFGKPRVEDREGFFYNLSHSGRYVVIAWGGSEVGVDVQEHDASTKTDRIAQHFFAPEEQAYVAGNPRRFYEIWTKKESYLKYTGAGLQKDLRSFSVLTPDPEIRYLYRTLGDEYSLSLCTAENDYAFELLDVKQLT